MPDVEAIASVEEVYAALQELDFEEAQVLDELDDLLDQVRELQPTWADRMAAVADRTTQLEVTHLTPVRPELENSARLAAAIQGRVEQLDQEKVVVAGARAKVEQTIALGQAIGDLRTALERSALDQASALVHRYLDVTPELLDSELTTLVWPPTGNGEEDEGSGWWDRADGVDGQPQGGDSVTTRPVLVRELFERVRAQLVQLVTDQFDRAVADHDTRTISQCFKLFPLLKQENAGLDRYSAFLCATLAQQLTARSAPQAGGAPSERGRTVARLTQLFESVARIVDNHFPVVETHYGPGKMVRVIQYLQRDIDSRVCRLLENFKEDISLDRQLADIRDYEDRSNRNGKLGSPIPGKRGHPARRDDGLPASLTRSLVDGLAPTASTTGPGTGAHREEPAVDIKPLHPLLTELSLIVQRITLYMRFLESRAAPEVEIIVSAGASVHTVYLNDDPTLLFNEAGLIRTSPLPSAVEHLSAAYIALENFILRYTARLALALEETEPDALVSAGVDDYFFVAKRSLQRALATAQPTAFKNVIYTAQTLSTHRFVPYLQRLLPTSPANTTPAASHGNLTLTKHNVHTLPAHPDGTPLPAFADVGVRNQRVAVALNNFETAARYMGKLVAELRRGIDPEVNPIWAPHPAAAIRGVQDALGELAAVEMRLGQLSRSLLEQFALITARPVMRTILQESYRDIKYVLSDEEYMDVKNDNLFVQRFVMKFNAVAVALQARLTPANLDLYLATALDYLVADWEKAVGLSKFNLLGAFCFDSDLRVLQQHFALYSETPLRDKFAKLGQMADVLTLEQVEDAEELWQANHLAQAMYLSADEFRGLLLNRLDLDAVRVKSLRL